MEQIKEFKRRSYRNCISLAIKYIASNALDILKENWKVLTFTAVAAAILESWSTVLMLGATYVGMEFHAVASAICTVLTAVLYVAFFAIAYSTVNGKGVRWNLTRSIKTVPLSIAIMLIYIIIWGIACAFYIYSSKNPESIPIYNLLVVGLYTMPLLVVLSVPLPYVYCRYMTEPTVKLGKTFWKDYVAGMRSFGFILLTAILSVLCAGIVALILYMPKYVLLIAQNVSAYGFVSNGDEKGLPEYFIPLFFLVSLFTNVVNIYIAVFYGQVSFHIYETVSCKEHERKEKKNYRTTDKH